MKKIISLVLVAVLALTAIGGTLAYFTDTDTATNVMTMGNVNIEMTEEQRVEKNGATLEAFEQKQLLVPIIEYPGDDRTLIPANETEGTIQYGLPNANNWIDKVVNVDNTGSYDAYVRVVFAFPAAFDDADSATNMLVHWNIPKENTKEYWTAAGGTEKVTIDNVEYNLYTYTYEPILKPSKTTALPAITGLYMDKEVNTTVENGKITYSMAKEGFDAKSATVDAGYEFKLYAFAQGVQSEGFTSATEALNAAFGKVTAENNPWTPATK